MWGPTKNLASIGPVVSTFIGYKLTCRHEKYIYTRLPSSISTFNCGFICEHFLCVHYIKKEFADFIIFFREFSKFYKNKNLIFEILIIHKPFLGSREVPHKTLARSVQPFWRLLDTNKQTERQAKFIYLGVPIKYTCFELIYSKF